MAYVTSSTGLAYAAGTESAPKKGLFMRLVDRVIAARMREAERQVESYLARPPEAERLRIEARLDAVAPRAR